MMNVIDVSRYQAGENIGGTGANAVTVGLTFGGVGVNPYAADEIHRARTAGMLTGLYHIRAGDGWTAAQEAQHFLDNATQYLDGKTPIFLDWEECTLSNVPWALAWCLYVYNKTGIMPIMYMSASVSLDYDWSTVRAANIGLWVAQYPYSTVTGFIGTGWTPPATSWSVLVGWQYAGTGGSVGGITGLDLSVFYLTPAQWVAYGTPRTTSQSTTVTPIMEDTLTAADIAAINAHADAIKADIIAYIQAVVTDSWRVDGVHTHPGIALVGESNQRDLQALKTAVAALPANVLNQPFTTAAGVKTNVPGLLDAINTRPVATVNLTAAQIAQLAATLKAELPAATLQALAVQLTK